MDSNLSQFYGKVTKKDIDEFLIKNQRSLRYPELFWGEDCNQNPASYWDKSNLRVLICFLSDGITRAVSSTYNAMDYLFKLESKQVFVDYSYRPQSPDYHYLIDNHIPVAFGNVSHNPWWEYDLVCISGSLMSEVLNLPLFLKSAGIPFGYKARMNEKIPLIGYGGAATATTNCIYGYIDEEHTDKSMVDFLLS